MILVESNRDIIYEFSRDDSGKQITKKIKKKPYFYYADKKGPFTTLTGEKASRCICNKPQDIIKLRDNYVKTFEDDVKFPIRHIIDKYYDTEIKKSNIRKWYLDIEVDDSQGFENIQIFMSPITSIGFYDSYNKKHYTLLLQKNINKNDKDHSVKSFETEKELLEFFVQLIKYMDPDLITAWNIMFDMPYIINRMSANNLNPHSLSRINQTIHMDDYLSIKGRVTLDLLQAYKKLTFNQLSSYALEFVAQQELGEGKEKYKGKLSDLDAQTFLEYNKRDVELLVILDEKIHIIDFFDTIRRMAKCNFHDVFSNKRIVDSFVLTKAKQKNIVLPGYNPLAQKVKFEGAYVKEPPKGLHSFISALDFKCLAPDEIVYTTKGYKKVQELKIGDESLSLDGKKNKIREIVKNKATSIMHIELSDGSLLKVTPNHIMPILGIGDIKSAMLQKGMTLLKPVMKNNNLSKYTFDELYELVGIFISEGNIYRKKRFIKDKQHPKGRYSTVSQTYICTKKHEKDFRKRIDYLLKKYCPYNLQWKEYTKDGYKSYRIYDTRKEVYDWFNNLISLNTLENITKTKSRMRSFVTGVFKSDANWNKQRHSIQYHNSKKDVFNIISHCLSILGIGHNVWTTKNKYGNNKSQQYYLEINYGSDIKNIFRWFKWDSYRDNAITKIKTSINTKDYIPIKIIKIEYHKKDQYVYDISMERQESPYFVHNGIYTHNSLYPSIIMQFNMSYETFIPLDQVHEYPSDRVINIEGKYHFLKDVKGFASEIMEELMDERAKVKKLMYAARQKKDKIEEHVQDMVQYAIKVIANSYYGVTTSPYFRLFRPEIGAAITKCGRNLIKFADKFCTQRGLQSVIIDTDSVYIDTQTDNLDDAIKVSENLNNDMEQQWEIFLDQYNAGPNRKIIMEHEKVYKTLMTIGVKKRYCGNVIWKDGYKLDKPKMDVKGLSVIRSDYPLKAQAFLKHVLELILAKKGSEECFSYIQKFKDEFKQSNVDEIGFPTSVKSRHQYKNYPIHVRASENSQKYLNIPYVGGSKVRYYFVKKTPNNIPFDDVWVFKDEIPDGFEIDWERTFERIINNPLEPFYDSLGWDFDKVKDPQQSKLNDWFLS